jgi:hypothetical protein
MCRQRGSHRRNGGANPTFPAAWVHHAHVILRRTGETEVRTGLHYLYNWAQDDRAQQAADNGTTREVYEDHIKDGQSHRARVGRDRAQRLLGRFRGRGLVYQGRECLPFAGLNTFGGEGNNLTDRWWGPSSGGNGKLFALGLNYNTSLGRMLRPSYSADAPDVAINAGFVMAYTLTNTLTPGTGPHGSQ